MQLIFPGQCFHHGMGILWGLKTICEKNHVYLFCSRLLNLLAAASELEVAIFFLKALSQLIVDHIGTVMTSQLHGDTI